MFNLLSMLASVVADRLQPSTPKQYNICAEGTKVSLTKAPFVRHLTNEAGDDVFTGESVEDNVTYGFITARLKNPVSDSVVAEQKLFLFLEELHPSFDIAYTTGLDHGFTHETYSEAIGMTDYWQDAEGKDWKVQAWTDGALIAVLYVKNINEAPFQKQDAFLKSVEFSVQKLA